MRESRMERHRFSIDKAMDCLYPYHASQIRMPANWAKDPIRIYICSHSLGSKCYLIVDDHVHHLEASS